MSAERQTQRLPRLHKEIVMTLRYLSCALALDTKAVSDTGVFEGYASTFGERDLGGDIVEAGAFPELGANERGDRIEMRCGRLALGSGERAPLCGQLGRGRERVRHRGYSLAYSAMSSAFVIDSASSRSTPRDTA